MAIFKAPRDFIDDLGAEQLPQGAEGRVDAQRDAAADDRRSGRFASIS